MGKTVTTYLIDGDPKGTQYSFISNKICQMFVVPRSNLSYLNEQEKLQKPDSPTQGRTFVLHERARMQRKGLLPLVGLYRLEGQSCGKWLRSFFQLEGEEREDGERIWGGGKWKLCYGV